MTSPDRPPGLGGTARRWRGCRSPVASCSWWRSWRSASRTCSRSSAVLLGLGVAAAGAWWLITEHPPRRWVGLGGAVIGLGVMVAAVIARGRL